MLSRTRRCQSRTRDVVCCLVHVDVRVVPGMWCVVSYTSMSESYQGCGVLSRTRRCQSHTRDVVCCLVHVDVRVVPGMWCVVSYTSMSESYQGCGVLSRTRRCQSRTRDVVCCLVHVDVRVVPGMWCVVSYTSMSESYQGCGVLSRTRRCQSRTRDVVCCLVHVDVRVVPGMWCVVSYTHVAPWGVFVKAVSEICVVHRPNSSVCRAFAPAHNAMSAHADLISFRSASIAMFLNFRLAIITVLTAGFSALNVSSMRWWSDRVRMNSNGSNEIVISMTDN